MKKLLCVLFSLLLLFQACTALASLPDDCTMHDVYGTWSKTQVYTGDEVTLAMRASGCGDDFTYQYFLDYTGDIVDDLNALWSTSAAAQGPINLAHQEHWMEVTQSFAISRDSTFTFTPLKPGFFCVSIFLTDANGHRALLSAQTLCVMEPGVETASSMMWTLARAAVDEAVTPGMTDREKAVALHDWVTTHMRYAYADMAVFTDYETWTSDYLTLNTLVLNEGVCSDYAHVYALLCYLADIRCFVVDSQPMSHAWNAVLIDGEWLQLDCTWDDPTMVIGGDPYCSGQENHEYLFMTEEQLAERTWSWDLSRMNLGVSR